MSRDAVMVAPLRQRLLSTAMASVQKHNWTVENATCASVNGCVTLETGTASAALRHPEFRTVWMGTFASSIGTWMQNVLLGAFVLVITGNPWFVGMTYFALIGPLLFLAPVGGTLADILDRRKMLVILQFEQLAFSVLLAFLASVDDPNEWAILFCALMIGIGNALSAPAIASLLPTLVPRTDLHGAVALQAVQLNLSRVIGPMVGALLLAPFSFGTVFAINAATYLCAIVSLIVAKYPGHVTKPSADSGLQQLLSGFRIAAADPLIKRVLITMATFSFFSVAFIGLMPEVARANFGVAAGSSLYGFLYATFGLGAVTASVAVGSYFADRSMAKMTRGSLLGFAVLLSIYALTRQIEFAFPAGFMLGFAYFSMVTSMSITLQSHLDDAIRGRITALWMMSFNGTVALGVLASGAILLVLNVTALLLVGATVAALLAVYCNLRAVGAD